MIRRLLAISTVTLGVLVLAPTPPASSHPLGNFTVNQSAGVVVQPESVSVDLVVDMAEIPTFQTRTEIDGDGDGTITPEENLRFRAQACDRLRNGITLQLDDQLLATTVESTGLSFPPGQAGLDTLRLTCELKAAAGRGLVGGRLHVENTNYTDRVGWREVTAVGEGTVLTRSDVPDRSPSRRLIRYPDDLLTSPLDVREANLETAAGDVQAPVAPGDDSAGSEVPQLRGADRFTSAFTGLVSRQDFTVWFALVALAVAVALGALHALAPGHGKTVMAAYLVGERGSLRQTLLLGSTVTATHTAGVLILGVLLSGSTNFVPEKVYPWLGLTSGALLAMVGAGLLRRAWRRRRHGLVGQATSEQHHAYDDTHAYDHGHGHGHSHGPDHGHGLGQTGEPGVSRRTLMAMGAAGGLVPSPSALVVLLGAIALGRMWFGIALVLSYGVGMALTLVAAGLLLVRARSTLDRRLARTGGWLAALARALPIATASLVVVAGVGLTARAISQL